MIEWKHNSKQGSLFGTAPPNFLLFPIKRAFGRLAYWFGQSLLAPSCNCLPSLNKPIFASDITGQFYF